jgi:hypothetical protein
MIQDLGITIHSDFLSSLSSFLWLVNEQCDGSSVQDHGVQRPLDRTVTSSLALLVRPVLPRLELGNTYRKRARRVMFQRNNPRLRNPRPKSKYRRTVLTLGRVVQMSIQPLRGVRVVVGRRLGHVLLVRVVLGQGGTRDGTPGKRTGTVRRGRLAERFLILDLYDVRRKRKIKPSRDQQNGISLGTKSIQIESIRVVMDFGVNNILTLAVNVGMFPETILHRLELFDAIHSLGFLVAVYETGKGGLEVFTAGALGHPAEALRSRGGFEG